MLLQKISHDKKTIKYFFKKTGFETQSGNVETSLSQTCASYPEFSTCVDYPQSRVE